MRYGRHLLAVSLIALAAVISHPAGAQPAPARVDASLAVDGAVIAGGLVLAGLASRLPVDDRARWSHELLPLDERVKTRFSASAARTSDLLLTLSVLTPLAVQVGQGFGPDSGRRAVVYSETLALSLALNNVVKHLVGRPRPYVYNPDPRVQAYGEREARDARLSFYSGHAATAFAAAVSGAYLFAQSSADTTARTAVWASSLMVAGATANLRVRAGKHFYSDVAVGAAVGAATGLVVPLLHQTGRAKNELAPAEWVAIASAPVAGAVLSQLLPLPADIVEPLAVPWVSPTGAGVSLRGAF